jgi:hypothetical protein
MSVAICGLAVPVYRFARTGYATILRAIPGSARTLDDSAVEAHLSLNGSGFLGSAFWLWVTGAFRFLGEDFQTVAGRIALAVLPEFLFDNIVSPVWFLPNSCSSPILQQRPRLDRERLCNPGDNIDRHAALRALDRTDKVRSTPLSCASASWLRPCTARSLRIFLARTSRSGPFCARFTDVIMPIDGVKATAFKIHSNSRRVGKGALAPCPPF